MPKLGTLGLACALCAGVWGTPSAAQACGGTFCDGGNPAMAVEQTGETVLFVFDGDFVEAHVQIEYDGGDASQFAWIIPLPKVPEVEVGAWRLIENALDATVPVYGYSTTSTCDDPSDSGDPSGFISSPDGGASSSDDPPPRVVVKDTVGAFEYVVLDGGTPESVNMWLDAEGYAANPAAPDILQEYLDEGALFLAFRLRHAAGTEDIHPVVIRYQGNEPCVPLRLTRIAAEDDMPIRVLFLGDERVLPTNYKHVLLNRTKLDWFNLADNYDSLVSRAIDDAGSRAFVTEYAGTSAMVERDNLETANMNASVFETIAVSDVVDQLVAFDLMACGRDSCSYEHELVPSLLSEFVPAPSGLDPLAFYACLDCFSELIDPDAWDGPAFAQAFEERIRAPLEHARDVLDTWPYLTRLYTRISPEEMLFDPMFAEVPDLPDVPNRLGAQREFDCCGAVWQLPGGRRIRAGASGDFPRLDGDLPSAERVEAWNPNGPPLTEYNGSALIDDAISQHNAMLGCEGGTTGGTGDTSGEGGAGSADSGAATAPGSGGPGSGTTAASAGADTADNDGCSCRGGNAGGAPWLAVLGLLLWRRRCDA